MRPHRILLRLTILVGSLLLPHALAAQGAPGRFASLDERWAAGAHRQTLTTLQGMSRKHPTDVEILWRLAWVKTDIGRDLEDGSPRQKRLYHQAVAVAERAVRAGRDHAQAHLTMAIAAGLAATVSGKGDRVRYSRVVRDHVNRAIALNPRNDLAYHVRGIWNLEIADLGFFTRTIASTVYGGLPHASNEQAANDFTSAIQLDDRIIHRIGLGRALIELKRYDEARTQLQAALTMPAGGRHAESHRRRARRMLADLRDR